MPEDPPGPPARALEHVVVVGGGLAGARAAVALREHGHRGRLTLVSAERHLPYDRPPLSKAVLLGEADDSTLDVDWPALDVDLRLGVRATALRPGVLDTDAGPLDHDGLVLATGAEPLRLPGVEAERAGVLRTREHAARLRDRLRPGARVVVVGAGWLGAEVATAAAARGCATTVVEAAGAPLAGALGREFGALTTPWYAQAGIDLRLDAPVAGVEARTVTLAAGDALPADVVVVAVGARPATGWLAGTGLVEEGAVAVDEHLAAALPGVVAAGDCSAWQSRRFGTRLHVEHWDDALHAPAVAAATLLGRPAVHDPVPYFWSEQLGHTVQFAGYSRDADQVVRRGGADQRGWSVCWLRTGRLQAVLAVDRPRDLLQGRRAVAAGCEPDLERLADPAVPLRDACA